MKYMTEIKLGNHTGKLILGLPLIMFLGCAVFLPVGIYNDTAQYISMHIHRDPLYSLFLWILRKIFFGGDYYLRIAVLLQNIFAWVSVSVLTVKFRDEYSLGKLRTAAVCAIAMLPHIVTPFTTASSLILSNGIMSEAITLPLFYLFAAYMLPVINAGAHNDTALCGSIGSIRTDVIKKDGLKPLLVAWLLSLARGQIVVMLIVWLVVAIYVSLFYKKEKALIRSAIVILVFISALGLRSIAVRSYNLAFNGHYTDTTMGNVSLLSNILYAADIEAAELIEDEKARTLYLASMNKADELGYNYKYASEGIMARGSALEAAHDGIKFECIDELWRSVHDEEAEAYRNDYVLENIEQDRVAGIIIRDILPSCIGTWLYDYISLAIYGFIRTVAFVSPIFNIYSMLVYIFAVFSLVWLIYTKRGGRSLPLIRLGLFTILTVCANVLATASVIMCLSRYMIYTLPLVYIYLMMVLTDMVKNKKP